LFVKVCKLLPLKWNSIFKWQISRSALLIYIYPLRRYLASPYLSPLRSSSRKSCSINKCLRFLDIHDTFHHLIVILKERFRKKIFVSEGFSDATITILQLGYQTELLQGKFLRTKRFGSGNCLLIMYVLASIVYLGVSNLL
jgi:hypothetical protein